MRGNLFSVVYEVANAMYGGAGADARIAELQSSVHQEIAGEKEDVPLHYLLFKLTNRCNSDCEYCSHAVSNTANEAKSDIPLELVQKTIAEAGALGATAMAINGGEPLVREDVLDIVRTTVDNGIVPVLMTNGILLPKYWRSLGDAGLRYAIISFDSIRPEIYEKQRGQSFEQALAGIKAAQNMMEEFPGTHVHATAVLTRDNVNDFIDLVKFMSERGIPVQISPHHHYMNRKPDKISIEDRAEIEALTERLLRMKHEEGYLVANSTGFIEHLTEFFADRRRIPADYRCEVGYTNLFIDAYGNVHPCWDRRFKPLGKLGQTSLEEIWHGELMQEYRRRMLECDCDGCWYMCTGEVSMLLDGRL
ncbi:radical SAM protein [Thermophilibacter sp.]|uniref:radical SAM protein n=1 Tax=Thermophilibacter sp. TaxID=2847309 RepID=UPI003A93B837